MMCKKLIVVGSKTGKMSVPCGQCFPCRVNKGRKWTARLLMESKLHDSSIFVTLSYRDEDLPEGDNLQKKALQQYIKNLRQAGIKLRYFAVGEYGSTKGRSHYHIAMFGPTMEQVFGTVNFWMSDGGFATHHDRYWKKGRVHIGELNNKTAGYICGYTIKKLTDTHDEIVAGRLPEFTLQSRKPPLGAPYIQSICKQVLAVAQYHENPEEEAVRLFEYGRIRINQKVWPLDNQMLRTVFRTLAPSPDGPNQKKTRAQLRHTISEWTGANLRNEITARSKAEKAERRARRLAVGRPF